MSPAKKAAAKKTAAKKASSRGASKKTTATKTSSKKAASQRVGAKKKTTAKKTASKKTAVRKPTAKKTVTKKAPTKKTTAKKTTAKKTTAKKTTAKKSPAKKTTAKKTTAKKTTAKTTAKKTTARKGAPAKTTLKKTVAKAPPPSKKKTTAERKADKTPVGKAAALKPEKPVRKPLDRSLVRPNPYKQAPTKKARPAKFSADDLKKIRDQLESEKADLNRQMTELEEDSFDGTQSDLTGEVGLDEDFADAGTATFDRERDLSIRNNIRDLVDQIDRAVKRIDEGVYGTCERCGNPIDAARLKALPHASLCLDCKRREERIR